MKRPIFILLTVVFISSGFLAAADEKQLLCTTFPIYQLTRNVTRGQTAVKVDLLLPAALGCPHHYALTPRDMRKLATADVLVINGLGMEEFLGAPLEKANPDLQIINPATSVTNLMEYQDSGHNHHEHGPDCQGHHSTINPHLFVSPRMAAALVQNIAEELARYNPAGAGLYQTNAAAYAERLNALADEMSAQINTLPNKRIIQPHGVFDYLARDIGLEIVAVIQPHGQEPSAAEMLHLIKLVREKDAGAVIWEPQYSSRVAKTVARETGIPAAMLDPVASGPEDAPLDYYEKTMRKNIEVLRNTLTR